MKWTVTGAVSASTYVGEFEAKTGEEAIEKAWRRADVSVCHQCARGISDPEVAYLTAESEGGKVVTTEETWQDIARAHGWGPLPKKAKGGLRKAKR